MRRMLPFLACLMLVLTGWAGMSHAAEAVAGDVAGVVFTTHVAGDGDEVPGDADNALPHHHATCHGHDLGTPAPSLARAGRVADTCIAPMTTAGILSGIVGRVPSRPPRA